MAGRPDGFTDLWTHSLERQITSRLTFDARYDLYPTWMPNQEQIVYASGPGSANLRLMMRSADGTGRETVLTENAYLTNPDVTADGETIVFTQCRLQCNIGHVGIDGTPPLETLIETQFVAIAPAVSPDMRWIAYALDSGGTEVYVRPYPDLDSGRWQVSANGGTFPVWSADGSALYFVEPDTNTLMVAQVTDHFHFATDRPEAVQDLTPYLWKSPVGNRNYSVDEDGKRILTFRLTGESKVIRVTLNWLEELERLAPTSRE